MPQREAPVRPSEPRNCRACDACPPDPGADGLLKRHSGTLWLANEMKLTDRPDEPEKSLSNPDGFPRRLQRGGEAGPVELTLFTLAVATATLLTLTTILMQVL